MNEILLTVGSQVGEVRRLFDWTHDELASKLGVSRPTIAKIEKCAKMQKTLLLSLLIIVMTEVYTMKEQLKKIQFDKWDNEKKRDTLLKDITSLGISSKTLSHIMPSLLSSEIASGVVATAIKKLPTWLLTTSSSEGEKVNSKEMKLIVEESLKQIELKLSRCFGLEDFTMESVVLVMEQLKNLDE